MFLKQFFQCLSSLAFDCFCHQFINNGSRYNQENSRQVQKDPCDTNQHYTTIIAIPTSNDS